MVPNDALINRIRALDFSFKKGTERVHIYKKNGSTLRVAIRRNQFHDDLYAAIILKQAGMAESDVKAFIASVKCTVH